LVTLVTLTIGSLVSWVISVTKVMIRTLVK
jgi:hypothetical protein